ncbi:MAG: glucosamine-6-phosphate deaminase, partial [Proteobacteria bacterium]|nr:glucosamine-6-phosphate deaminase [Pseudomonadota bacterium]
TGWPGGKPHVSDERRPERAEPAIKRVVVFSPHPDDDVISMGGTLQRLVDHDHEVHVAYQTNGNVAVADDKVQDIVDLLRALNEENEVPLNVDHDRLHEIEESLASKDPLAADIKEVQFLKGLIRKVETISACRFVGIPMERNHHLDLPFYHTGEVIKKPLSQDDIDIVIDFLQEVKPHQIFAAGDLSDPHGTHRVCLNAIFEALKQLKGEPWLNDCRVWLYRGAWAEWPIAEADMAVPISPEELMKKRISIFRHGSQKDGIVFPGSDSREFWQRAEARNRGTAEKYNALGFAEYEAIELFVRYRDFE